ncbi:MAG: hypothetical protein ACQESM_05925, partial [Bacteroidota bacterium]
MEVKAKKNFFLKDLTFGILVITFDIHSINCLTKFCNYDDSKSIQKIMGGVIAISVLCFSTPLN